MQCPNCGRKVRSKHQCAHCGYVFGSDDKVENQDDKPIAEHPKARDFEEVTIVPKTPRKKASGIGKFIWGIVKLLLMVLLVFLAFMFGPQLYKRAEQFFNGSTQVAQAPTKESESTEASQETSAGEESMTSADTSESTQAEPEGLVLKDSQVNLDNFPIVQVTLDLQGPVDQISRDTFSFKLMSNGQEKAIDDEYSLIKEGNRLKISYNDPSADVLSNGNQEQSLLVEAKDLNFKETVTYKLPQSGLDQAQHDQFNEIYDRVADTNQNVSAMIQEVGSEQEGAMVYDSQSVDADAMIAWFILARVYQAIDQDSLSMDQVIPLNQDLIAEGDQGEFAQSNGETDYSVESLLRLVIQQQDVTAMNHLIQATGGPNDFNLWLNESNYFGTKVTNKLASAESGSIQGAVTNVKDIVLLLEHLAQNKLINETADQQLKEALLQTPISRKYPEENLPDIRRRYEITSTDENNKQQYYSAILEAEEKTYVVVILASELDDPTASVDSLRQAIHESVQLLITGEVTSTEEETSETTSETESTSQNSQVEIIGEEPVVTAEPAPEYSEQYVEGRGNISLPIIRDGAGNPIPVTWYWNEATQSYQYTTGN